MSADKHIAEPVGPGAPRGRRLRRRGVLAGLVVVVALSLGALAWAWRHPDQSFDGGYGMTVRRQVGQPVWTTLVHTGTPGAERVSISSLEPRVATDGTEAVVEYVICELDPRVLDAQGVGGFGYGMHAQDVRRYCLRTRPAEGATLPLRSDPPQEVLLGVTPTRPGRTVISGHRMSFGVGWRRGSAELDVALVVVARPRAD